MVPKQTSEAQEGHGRAEKGRGTHKSELGFKTHNREHSRFKTTQEIEGWKNNMFNDALAADFCETDWIRTQMVN